METQLSPAKGHSPHTNFRPMNIVAKRLDGSTKPLGMEIGLGPDDVLDGAKLPLPHPEKKGTSFRNF